MDVANELTKKLNLGYRQDYFFLRDIECDERSERIIYKTEDKLVIEQLISEADRRLLNIEISGGDDKKKLWALKFKDALSKKNYEPDEETKENFKRLFNLVGIYQLKKP